MASAEMSIQVALTDDAAAAVEVLDGLFEMLDDMAEMIPEWNTFELKAIDERRNALAEKAGKLFGTNHGSP